MLQLKCCVIWQTADVRKVINEIVLNIFLSLTFYLLLYDPRGSYRSVAFQKKPCLKVKTEDPSEITV